MKLIAVRKCGNDERHPRRVDGCSTVAVPVLVVIATIAVIVVIVVIGVIAVVIIVCMYGKWSGVTSEESRPRKALPYPGE